MALESLGFHTYLGPGHVERVYFEYLVRPDSERVGLPLDLLIEALVAEGCEAQRPRYPLLHQQPLFTECTWREIARLPDELPFPEYAPDALPNTQLGNMQLLKLPSFPNAERALLDQYIAAFRKVVGQTGAIRARRG